jgi:hypothetical protein
VVDGVTLRRTLGGMAPAFAACLVMAVAVLLLQHALTSWQPLPPVIRLAIEVSVGGVAYVAAAALLARRVVRELISKLRVALKPQFTN